jgi:DNA-binding response OmpR family regulator
VRMTLGEGDPVEVLIAYSGEVSRRALAGALAGLDVDFIEAPDGACALDVLMRAEPPRLAFIEWDLPIVEGPELCRLLRDLDLGQAPHVILLTRETADRDVTAGLVAGASDFVCTPASARELLARRVRAAGRRAAVGPLGDRRGRSRASRAGRLRRPGRALRHDL